MRTAPLARAFGGGRGVTPPTQNRAPWGALSLARRLPAAGDFQAAPPSTLRAAGAAATRWVSAGRLTPLLPPFRWLSGSPRTLPPGNVKAIERTSRSEHL